MYCYCSQGLHKSSLPYVKILVPAIFFLKTRRSSKNSIRSNSKQTFYPESFPVARNFVIDRWNSELAYPLIVISALQDQTENRKVIEGFHSLPTNMDKVKLSETIWWNLWNDTQTSFDFNTAWPTYTGRLKVAIVGGVDQSLNDNCTMFPYLTQPILLAKFETCRQEKWITIYVLF